MALSIKDPETDRLVRDLVGLGLRAPSAGFSQGWDFVALLHADDRAAFWAATVDGVPDLAAVTKPISPGER